MPRSEWRVRAALGRRCRSAIRRAAMTRRASRIWCMAQPTTRRVWISRTATRLEPALTGEDAGGISGPGLIGPVDGEFWEPVGCDRSAVVAVGCPGSVFGALPGEDPFRAHETSNAIASPGATQGAGQSWAAIALATAGKLS